ADLARGELERGVLPFARLELGVGAGAPGHLRALAGLHLDSVDRRPERNLREREAVARLRAGVLAAHHRHPDGEVVRRDDVALLAVGIGEERDAGRPVRVVLDRGDPGGDAVLVVPLEVDDPVAALVAAALVARGDPAVVVAAALLLEGREETLLRLGLRDGLELGDGALALPRRHRLEFANSHCCKRFGLTCGGASYASTALRPACSLDALEEVDLAGLQRDDRLLVGGLAPFDEAA